MRKRSDLVWYLLLFCILAAAFAVGCIAEERNSGDIVMENRIIGTVQDTSPHLPGRIGIDTIGTFNFNPKDITTVRKDIFRDGYFSIFDILVYLDMRGSINLDYHFDAGMNTYVIDAINNKSPWWYVAYYDGGWPENNAFRMDHYPVKDGMEIRLMMARAEILDGIYLSFQEEIRRKEGNKGKTIIPQVVIRGPRSEDRFEQVEIASHNLRNDTFQEGVITTIDTIMTLGDRGNITYTLQWYETIGTAGIVKNYFVDAIGSDRSVGRCGFVYETGPSEYKGFRGNHIHIPSDTRILNSPEYVEYFWICL